MEKILIIEDDDAVFRTLAALIQRMGYEAAWKPTLEEGLREVRANAYDVVLLDVHLPDGCGLDTIAEIRRTPAQPEVIIMTGFGNVNGAEIAVNNGAWDYIQKRGSTQDITLSLKRVLEYRKEKVRHGAAPVALSLKGIVGESKPLTACYDQLAQAAAGDANVLLSGETGTGKEIFARAIHENSRRSSRSLVVVDCAALPETLVESLLFGHEKGVYTGADKAREGLVAQADGGTLFLDEVGELPPAIQKVFLRVLQERKYRPVGGQRELPSNFRLLAATNRDLDQMVADGRFRQDLLYRIRTIAITLPPLWERGEDIKLLAVHYLSKIAGRYGVENKGISPDFMDALKRYPWPGNVRELVNALETAISSAGPEATLYSRHLPQNIRLHVIQGALELPPGTAAMTHPVPPAKGLNPAPLTTFKAFRKAAVASVEREYLRSLLDQTQNSLNESLNISGLSRSRFYELLKHHHLGL
ncbi:sigma-54-dependent transcriptional regulator [Desulfosarcina sp.]|uniref:sigma-54-dependent transcriptional regulator n=1 Tax=Desulfosarcina sp. TaxID=2027861 RepID=UPI0039706BD9